MPAPPWPALIRDRVRGSQAGRPPARATTDASRSGGLAWLEAAWAVAGLDGLGGGRPALRAAQGAGERLPHDRDMQPHRLAEHRPEPRRVRNRAGLAEAGDNLAAGRLQGDDVEMVPAGWAGSAHSALATALACAADVTVTRAGNAKRCSPAREMTPVRRTTR